MGYGQSPFAKHLERSKLASGTNRGGRSVNPHTIGRKSATHAFKTALPTLLRLIRVGGVLPYGLDRDVHLLRRLLKFLYHKKIAQR